MWRLKVRFCVSVFRYGLCHVGKEEGEQHDHKKTKSVINRRCFSFLR